MKNKYTLILVLLCTLIICYVYFKKNNVTTDINIPSVNKLSKEERIDQAFKFEYEKTHDPRTNTIPTERLIVARQVAAQKLRENSRGPGDGIPDIIWEERGPNNIGGRTRAILIDVSDNTNNTVWAGGVSGGLWKTTNFQSANPSWSQIDDFFDNLAVTTIIQDINNSSIMYFGTGEGWANADAVRGLGIWKTIDSGSTWSQLSSTNNSNFYYVQDLLFDTNGNLYATTGTGLYKSSDDGTTWTKVLGAHYEFHGDLEIGADGDIYVSTGRWGTTGKVFKSDFNTHGANTGNNGTWTDISPTGNFHRIEMATAPNNANRIYLLCQGQGSSNVTKIFRSDNAAGNSGITWTSLTVPTIIDQGSNSVFTRGQAWYDLIAQVDPNNADVVFIGGVDALRSTDAGANWTQMTTWSLYGAPDYGAAQNVHADHHNFIFMPGSSSQAILTTDGGIHHTTDANNTASFPSWQTKNNGYNITQYYACATSNEPNSTNFLAGSQDNGTQRFTSSGINSGTTVTGGDGGFCHIDQDNPNIQISSYVYNNYWITNNSWSGGTTTSFNENTGRFINPTDYDNETNILYGAHNDNTYSYIKEVGTSNTYGTTSLTQLGGKISAVRVSPNTANRVFFGAGGGNIVRVDNAHTNSPTATIIGSVSTGLPNTYISCIAVQNGDDNHLLVTYSNYGVTSIYETKNGGTTWTDVEGDLPDMPVRWIEFNPNNNNQAIIATELGVWSTTSIDGSVNVDGTTVNTRNGTTKWGPTNSSLANVRVDMLQIRPIDNYMLAATHGRGLFSSESLNLPVELDDFSGIKQSNSILLKWNTLSEQNNDYFEVQHAVDGLKFTTIGRVSGKGTTLDESLYSHSHRTYKEGVNYYRLKQVDFDGAYEFSKIISVVVNSQHSEISYALAPNPVSTEFNLNTNNNTEENITVSLFNTAGELVDVLYDNKSKTKISLSIGNLNLPRGMYFVQIQTESGKRQVIKMFKKE